MATTQNGTLEEIIRGPARENDGTFNLMGGLRTSMATTGYRDIAEFNRAELMVAPALQTEGKQLQREQGVGMGATGGHRRCRRLTPPPLAVRRRPASLAGRGRRVPHTSADAAAATEEVVVLDYGGQYSQLIARRVRECGVFSELLPHHVGAAEVARRRPRGVILSGGPASVYEPGAPRLERELLDLGVPVLGICYGMQLLALELGGRVEGAEVGEFGRSQLTVERHGPAARRHPARADLLDVPPRHRVLAAAGLHRAGRLDLPRRWPRSSRSSAACTGSSSTPRSCTRPTATRS